MEEQNNKEQIKHYSIVSDIWYFIKHFKKYQPIVLVLCTMEIILGVITPLLGIYIPKLAVDAVGNGWRIEKTIIILGGLAIVNMLVNGLEGLVVCGKYHYYNSQRNILESLLFLKSLRIRYEDTESGEIKKIYWKAVNAFERGDWSCSSRMVTGTIRLVCSFLCFILYSTIIGSLNFLMLVVIIILSFLNYSIGVARIKFNESIREEEAENNKHYNCVRASMGSTVAAKDIRMFGMQNWLIMLRDKVLADMRRIDTKRAKKESFYEKLSFIIAMVRDLGAYAYLIFQASRGNVTVGEFVLYFGAITGFSSFVENMMSGILDLRNAANDTDYVRAYMELPEEGENEEGRSISELSLPLEFEFKNVSFTYKDVDEEAHEKQVLKDFNLKIKAGEKVALVGVNGAGKTTIVKLLCGMYDDYEGEILINGINRNEFSRKELYKLFSVVFQEQLVLPFTIGENIAMERAANIDEDRAWDALKKAGIRKVFEEKNITLKTYIEKHVKNDGISLSGGQQQRLLLARALYKDGPVLVLDEPTAALDPIAESEIYESYAKYTEGKTSLFISHRLASTRFSDRIVMLCDGKILEMGTHEELMKKGGSYAEMFNVQSSYYESEKEVAYGE